jgi:hypothetical protein
MPDDPIGPAFDDDALDVHLFLCLEDGHYAVTARDTICQPQV